MEAASRQPNIDNASITIPSIACLKAWRLSGGN